MSALTLSRPALESLGLSATFRIGGDTRAAKLQDVALDDGDIVVFGGAARLMFHGEHTVLGASRINLTFRRAL